MDVHGNAGYCTICDQPSYFVERGAWLRDQYVCLRCNSVPRARALMLLVQLTCPDWRTQDVYESSPAAALSAKLSNDSGSYTWSHFVPTQPRGSVVDNLRSENLECLTFEDEQFDIVITQDVFEHVLRPDLAFREIARVLRPGGRHVFTVPLYQRPTTLVRATPGPDGPLLSLPAEYHGDPVNENGSLVVREWGDDIVDFVKEHSDMDTERHAFSDRQLGLDGEFLDVLVSAKAP